MRNLTKAVTIATMAGAYALPAAAQQDGGWKLTFGLDTTARYDDNYALETTSAGKTTQLASDLTFGTSSTTHTQSIGIDGGFRLQATRLPDSGTQTDATNPFLRAHYQALGPSSKLTASAGWSRNDRSLTRTGSLGNETSRRAALGYAFGTDLPFGGNVNLGYSRSTYENASDSDSRTKRAQAGLHFALTPALTLRTSASYQNNETGGTPVTTTDNTSGTVGVGIRLNGTDTLNLDATANRIEVTDVGTETVTGGTYSAQYVHQGQVVKTSLTASTALSLQGRRTSLSVDQSHDIKDATLSYGIGVQRDTQDQNIGTAHLEWRQNLDATSYNVALRRGVETDTQGNETLVTTAATSVTHAVNDTVSLSASLDYNAKDETDGISTKDGKAAAGIGFALGPDWQLNLGAERRVTVDSSDATATSNAVFATIGRTWVAYR